jgi:UDP-N-acetylglucosamine 4-epimerase
MQLESPQINGDGNYSRDLIYIDNVIQMNELATFATNKEAVKCIPLLVIKNTLK